MAARGFVHSGLAVSLVIAAACSWVRSGGEKPSMAPPQVVDVDPEKLRAALGNLLSNAIRFSPPGGSIRFALARQPGLACIDIRDEGPGVAEGDRARVFEPFYRGERQPEGAVKGTGIGLSIVREYVEAHGGRVELLADGPGAHFRIELPHAID